MKLKPGDIVRTESGKVGKVVHTTRLTVFVALPTASGEDTVAAYLESQLTKVAEFEEKDFVGPNIEGLSARERQVFTSIGEGQTVQEIAVRFYLSLSTVESYRNRLKQKLRLGSRAALTRCAILWVAGNPKPCQNSKCETAINRGAS